MTGAQALINKGRKEMGQEMLLKLLTAKFGAISDAMQDKVKRLSLGQVERIMLQALDADTLSDLKL
ncbi:MAG TPA: DUF4351 domain-containing protein [Chthonomonadaceae bacterium]|nr:DUF4351 domain-containing protein [Chthonomonadaceae bacterium]